MPGTENAVAELGEAFATLDPPPPSTLLRTVETPRPIVCSIVELIVSIPSAEIIVPSTTLRAD